MGLPIITLERGIRWKNGLPVIHGMGQQNKRNTWVSIQGLLKENYPAECGKPNLLVRGKEITVKTSDFPTSLLFVVGKQMFLPRKRELRKLKQLVMGK